MTAKVMLSLENVQVRYDSRAGPFGRVNGSIPALEDVSIDLREGEVLGLLGESGSGKSTLGRVMLGLIKPTTGAVRFRGEEIASMPEKVRSVFRRKAQLIFQDPLSALDPTMSIEDIVTEPLRIQRSLPRSSKSITAQALLKDVSLDPKLIVRRPSELSGGQRQRVGIARALSVRPNFVVADEPVSALDVSIQAQVISLLSDLRRSMELTMLFISHDITVVRYIADRIAVIYLGRIVEVAPAATLMSNPVHPYTQMLLASAPDVGNHWGSEKGLMVPTSQEPPRPASREGCVFAHRCPHVTSNCRTATSKLRLTAADHSHACSLRADGNGERNAADADPRNLIGVERTYS